MPALQFNLIGFGKLTENRQQEQRQKTDSAGDGFASLLRDKAEVGQWRNSASSQFRPALWRQSGYDAGMPAWRSDAPDSTAKQPALPERKTPKAAPPADAQHEHRASKRADAAEPREARDKTTVKEAAKARKDDDQADDGVATGGTEAKQQADGAQHHAAHENSPDPQNGQQSQGEQKQPEDSQTGDGQTGDAQTGDGKVADGQAASGQAASTEAAIGTAPVIASMATSPSGADSTGNSPAGAATPPANGTVQPDQAGQQMAAVSDPQVTADAALLGSGTVPTDQTTPGAAPAQPTARPAAVPAAEATALSIQPLVAVSGKSTDAAASAADNPLIAAPRKDLADKDGPRHLLKTDTVRAPQAVVQSAQTQQPQPSATPASQAPAGDAGTSTGFGNADFGDYRNGGGNYGGFGLWPMPAMLTASAAKQADFVAALKQQLGNMPLQEQVAVHMQRAARDGVDKISIQLSPEELGRIHVKMDIDDDKKVRATVTVERPGTLDLLQRDSRALERALHDAGLKTDSGSLSFSLQRGNSGDFSGSGEGGTGGRQGSGASGQAKVAGPAERISTGTAAEIDTANGVVDVEV